MSSPTTSGKGKARVSTAMGEPKSGSKLPIETDDLHPSAMVMAETQTPSGPVKDTTDVGNAAEKVSRGAITRFREGISPLPSTLKMGLNMDRSQDVEATLHEEEVNVDDSQHLEEAHQAVLEKSRKAKGKAPLVEDDAPIRAPFVPRSIQVCGGRFQRGVPEDDWTLVGRGNPALADMLPVAPAQDIPSSSKSEEGLLGENVRGYADKGRFVEEEPANEEEVAQVSPAEAI
ncbi:hypothetical protein U1Q18_017830 [Sarracenia purpurea var. burkii]